MGSTPVQHERAGTEPVASAVQHPPRTTYGYVPYISIVAHTCAATETRDMRAKNKPFWNFTSSPPGATALAEVRPVRGRDSGATAVYAIVDRYPGGVVGEEQIDHPLGACRL